MFKLQFNRDGADRREESVIGHDRFCQQKHFSLPRYKRKRNNRRTQEETELAFELVQVPGESDESSSASTIHRSASALQYASSRPTSTSQLHSYTRDNSFYSKNTFQNNKDKENGASDNDGQQHPTSSWVTISRYFSTIAATLACRDTAKNTIKYNSKNCDYNRLGTPGEEALNPDGLNEENQILRNDSKTFSPHHRVLRMEKRHGHTLCMNYLESMTGIYVLVDNLPDIGWRPNRLWYLIYDTRFNAERLLTVTSYNGKSPLYSNASSTSLSELKEICQALQHPYVSPILDLEVLGDEKNRFIAAVTPVTAAGSLRDLFHQSRWTDTWRNKYVDKSFGISEIQVQRLSCHILQALLQLRSRGLPAGIGGHLHSGNVLIQHGIARFSAVDNILFGHTTSNNLFITESSCISNPEIIDSIAFAHLLFSMCSGYDLATIKLSAINWNDIRDYAQVSEVLEFILENADKPFPSLNEIAQLEFYRNIDLRELRALPAPEILSGPGLSALNVFVDSLEKKRLHNGITLQRPHSTSTPSISKACEEDSKVESPSGLNHNGSSSSQMSLYWTPPNSLGFITKVFSNECKVD